jgi:hypothetical protein
MHHPLSRDGNRDFEGATHVDALLLNASNGFALLVEAKVLSDVSYQVSAEGIRRVEDGPGEATERTGKRERLVAELALDKQILK